MSRNLKCLSVGLLGLLVFVGSAPTYGETVVVEPENIPEAAPTTGELPGRVPKLQPGEAGNMSLVVKPPAKTDEQPKHVLPALKDDEPLITVNGESLTWGAMRKHTELMVKDIVLPPGVTVAEFEEERDAIMMRRIMTLAENYIVKTLFAQEARRQKLTLTDKEVRDKLEEIFAQVKSKRARFQESLDVYNSPGSYLTIDVTNSLLFAKLKSEVIVPSIEITPAEIAQAIADRVQQNKELVEANTKLRPKLQDILEQIKGGEAFDALAFTESDCDSSYDGGEWGTFKRGEILDVLYDVALALKEGELSDIVETPFSYHILKLVKKNYALPAEDSKEAAPVVSVKLAHIMLEKKEPLPEFDTETAKKFVLAERTNEAVELMRDKLLAEAVVETPLKLK